MSLPDAPPPALIDVVGGGLVVADFDDDGLLDVLLPGPSRYYRQLPGRGFEDRTADALPDLDLTDTSAASAVDYDADGDLDVLVVRFQAPVVLLRNDGGVFTDTTAASGLPRQAWPGTGGCWGDVDHDGDLDLFLARYFDRRVDGGALPAFDKNQLVRNEGDGTFVDITSSLPRVAQDGATFTGGWHDLDDDGWLDLMVVNDFGETKASELLWNRAGALVPDDQHTGLRFRMDGMGMGVGDLNGDLVQDLVFSSQGRIEVQESQPGGVWFQSGEARGLQTQREALAQHYGWGTEIADLDLDGDDDVVVGFGHWEGLDEHLEQHDAVFRQDDAGLFADTAIAEGVSAPGVTRGLVVADLDRDGCPDLVRRQLGTDLLIDFGGCVGGWLAVELRQPGPNPFAVGATVTVHSAARSWRRAVHAGSTSLFSGGPPEVLFGLGEIDVVDVEIRWPDGAEQRLEGIETHRRLAVTRGP